MSYYLNYTSNSGNHIDFFYSKEFPDAQHRVLRSGYLYEMEDRHIFRSVPMYSPKKVIQINKSITAIRIFELQPEVKSKLCGGKFWTSDYYVNTVGQYDGCDSGLR